MSRTSNMTRKDVSQGAVSGAASGRKPVVRMRGRRYESLIPYFFMRRWTVLRSTQAVFAAWEILPS